ncbi:hypothetical protein ABH15_12195 [Methanoculleus taiwanensis]|uniref:Thioredoxin domain-containing protein n=1 Tax=Methanoculleus taiwanensis TaxID=1550565 RepID=A0A498GXF9_9EURY|nr:thioredoxin-like domain-containing protein [Methanoculleus taiwanensis]RXE55481.1 hypothetical protein ABH15_12195 [Methanoculleus taiwanensis]
MEQISLFEFPADLEWFNTDRPLSMQDLAGKIVLLDFWTFCCVSCMQVMPDITRLVEKYPELVVIGVHSPRYELERVTGNIREAILHTGFEHPVIVDRDLTFWRRFGIRSWPSFVLIDPEGAVVGKIEGEGIYERLDPMIAKISRTYEGRGTLKKERMAFGFIRDTARGGMLYYPGKIEADYGGERLFISDSNHHRILLVRPDGKILEAIGSGKPGRRDGSFEEAAFYMPQGLAYDGRESVLYVADTGNHLIRRVSLRERTVETIAGTGLEAMPGRDIGGDTDVALSSPRDLVLLGEDLWIAMAGTRQIWRMDLATHEVRPYAGTGAAALIDGPLEEAAFAEPTGITTDGEVLYVADSDASAIRQICRGMVTTRIGHGLTDFGDLDTIARMARVHHPLGVTFADGRIYIADTGNHKIKWLDVATDWVISMAGNGRRGYRDGLAGDGMLSEPGGLVAFGGLFYIADTGNHAIRVYDPVRHLISTLAIWK